MSGIFEETHVDILPRAAHATRSLRLVEYAVAN